MDRSEQIQSYARATFGIGLAVDAFALQLRLLMEQLDFIEEQIQDPEEAIGLTLKEHSCNE
jgi:hypothetical protein